MWLFEVKSGSRTAIEEVLEWWLRSGLLLLPGRLFSGSVSLAGLLVGAVTSLDSLSLPQYLVHNSSRREK